MPERAPARAGTGPGEQRLYGLNACLAAFRARPGALRKVWLLAERRQALREVLAWCAAHRLGYRIVEREDLDRLVSGQHHEGVCFAMLRPVRPRLRDWLASLPPGPSLALWLDGVGNPHNLGAILRSGAHFGVSGVLVPEGSTLDVSGAAARVAEGGAEALPLVDGGSVDAALPLLRSAGFTMAATVVRDGQALFDVDLPRRLVLVMGAEGDGVGATMYRACATRLEIPGSGAVESLNVGAATAVFLAEWLRQGR